MADERQRNRVSAEVRQAIQASAESVRALSQHYGLNPKTIVKWKRRSSTADLPAGARRGRSTVLSADDEKTIIAFRRAAHMSLDECLRQLKPTIPRLTRSSLHRCLVRHGISRATGAETANVRGGKAVIALLPGQGARDKRQAGPVQRREILAVAGRSFVKYGYDRTSMSAISSELGGSKSTLWKHFPSKEALFSAFLEQSMLSFPRELAAMLDPDMPLRPAIETYSHRFLAKIHSIEWVELYRLIIGTRGRFRDVSLGIFEQAVQENETVLSAFIAKHMAAGHLRADNLTRAVSTLISLCDGSRYHQALLYASRLEGEELASEARYVTDTFLRIYAVDDRTAGSPAVLAGDVRK